ncbi:Zinc finger CCHC domain-containing protein 8-like protein [Ooceraea biroi]|uniref:Zinc finger CCHC domain-containing protein 8-like protein n=1 Tax=Ooceraea biroi TaxID=2015173 RepID=A0A026WP52_OOCBI|nr:Zinc finger CCHC domain-containing protein 8-like protein [Ooceraea biroi]
MSVDNMLISTITVEDSETEVEVVDLNSNSDTTEMICRDYSSSYDSKNTEHSSSDDTDANVTCPLKNSKSTRSDDGVSQPAFKVMFRDEDMSRQYRKKIKDFLYDLIQSKPSPKEDADTSRLILEIWDNKANSEDMDSYLSTENNDSLHSLPPNDTNGECNLFTIDNRPNINDHLDIPAYGQKYENSFKKSDSEALNDCVPKLNCFNCNGNHNMRDCPLPRNQANINKNRKEFVAKNNSGVRYHLSDDQRFSHMIPGQLSSKLRQALGLKDNQLPVHIYQMRLLGYPPGWLEEARLQHSGLSLFNSDGVAEADPNDEEGEIIATGDKDQYDLKKIHEFPGFNIPPPPGTIDDSNNKYWIPQMRPMHSKEMMLLQLQGKKAENGYKRKKLKLSAPVTNASEIPSDMEIEDAEDSVVENVPIDDHFIPPLPKESVPTPPVPPSSGSFESIAEDSDSQSRDASLGSADDATANSPSLSELESAKKELLIELEDMSSSSNCTPLKSDLMNITPESEAPYSDITSQSDYSSSLQRSLNQDHIAKSSSQGSSDPSNDLNSTFTSDTSLLDTSNSDLISPAPKNTSNPSQCVKVHLGTPILQSNSPYNKLPSSEKFSQNICNVINFENLPDATGKYEQMSGVLQRVRSTIAKLNQQT